MNKDASDFMIQEYDQIARAYFGLRDQVNEWFKAYITLVGLPLTVLAAVLKLGSGSEPISIANLPDVVSALLILVAFLGFFVTLGTVNMRMEMILYARTINDVRRYFAVLDQKVKARQNGPELATYLILPTSDAKPRFFEPWRAVFWQVAMIGALDGIIFAVGIQSLARIGWLFSDLIALLYVLLHLVVYWWMAKRREKNWQTHFPQDLSPSNA